MRIYTNLNERGVRGFILFLQFISDIDFNQVITYYEIYNFNRTVSREIKMTK